MLSPVKPTLTYCRSDPKGLNLDFAIFTQNRSKIKTILEYISRIIVIKFQCIALNTKELIQQLNKNQTYAEVHGKIKNRRTIVIWATQD